ncbi:MAG: DNA primase [Solirubrobacteraceae bacterium]
MALYTKESKDRVRDAVDFLELVSARTELRRAGPARYEGLCPFHEERTPSFGIDPTQKVYYCFGCQASGDLFTFVQETEGVDFKEALELLAERCNVELQREQEDPREQERRRQRERLLELLSRTAGYYERYLRESSEAARARDYLAQRGLGEEILREFRVGYAPSAWDRVLLASRRGGFSAKELYATGLAQRAKGEGRLYDRFRSRIMFPLSDVRGRVLGFGARALDDGAAAGSREGESRRPKYLNTSDNDVYHKGLHLYGAHLARAHAAKAGVVILCEGYTDVIALHQAGMRNAVGVMGTALTSQQVGELARMAQTVLLALDADTAGQEAMLRAATLAAKAKLELRVVPLPDGTDPAELVQREGAQAMAAAVERSVPFVRFRVERVLASGDDGSAEGRDRMIAELRPVFAQIPPGAMRMELSRIVAGRLGVPDSVFEDRITAAARAPTAGASGPRESGESGRGGRAAASGRRAAGRNGAERSPLSRRVDTERAFLALCIAAPDQGERALAALDVDQLFSSELTRRAARHLREGRLAEPMAPPAGDGRAPGEQEGPEHDEVLRGMLAELIVLAGAESANPAMLEVQRLQLELARLERGIQHARGREAGDVTELAKQRAQVKAEFDRAYALVLEQTGERE